MWMTDPTLTYCSVSFDRVGSTMKLGKGHIVHVTSNCFSEVLTSKGKCNYPSYIERTGRFGEVEAKIGMLT